MSRKKRTSKVLEKADIRLAAVKSLGDTLDLGNGLTVSAYNDLVTEVREQVSEYNKALSNIDKLYSEMIAGEQRLGDVSELMLMSVATKYGKSSNEYKMAGGVQKTERRRSTRKGSTSVGNGVAAANSGTSNTTTATI